MTRYANDGMITVRHVPSVANKAAPTVAEINAGTDLTPHMTKDGLTVPSGQNMVDDSNLNEVFDAQVVGSYGGPISMTMKRNNGAGGTDTAWNLITYGLAGYLVVRRGIASATAFAASQAVEVYPVQYHEPVMMQTATNEQARFTAQAAVTSAPSLKAVVAA